MSHLWQFRRLIVLILSFVLAGCLSDAIAESASASTDPDSAPLALTVEEAILTALEDNEELKVERVTPLLRYTREEEELAFFEPVLSAELSRGRVKSRQLARFLPTTEFSDVETGKGTIAIENYFPTGTRVTLEASSEFIDSSLYTDRLWSTRHGVSIVQSLLAGNSVRANLASLRQARLDTQISEYELRGFAETLVARVEQVYWDHYLAGRRVEILSEAVKLAEQQVAETEERIKVGKLPETERAAVGAELAQRRQDLIQARSDFEKTRLQLLRLVNPSSGSLWRRQVELLNKPILPAGDMEPVEAHVELALRLRPDLNEARLQIRRAELEIVKTRNGLLPKLDVFITLGASGYSKTFEASYERVDGDHYDIRGGFRLTYPILNREARARHRRAALAETQVRRAMENLTQLAELDVRTAYVEATRAREQIAATTATRQLREEALRAESAKFQVGKSTSLLVAQAQRDFVFSQIAEIEALARYLQAIVDLHRVEGSLLERRGIVAPGRTALPESFPRSSS